MLQHGFVKLATSICQSCSIFFSPFVNKPKLKFDEYFKACWSFCFEREVLNESQYSMPWVRGALGNVFSLLQEGMCHVIFAKKWPESAKYDHGSCSNKTLPRIEGPLPIPSFSIISTETRVQQCTYRGGICHSRHSRQECKIFASGVNFSRNNAVCYINESKKLHFTLISSQKLLTYY